jgi:hypothetical protein
MLEWEPTTIASTDSILECGVSVECGSSGGATLEAASAQCSTDLWYEVPQARNRSRRARLMSFTYLRMPAGVVARCGAGLGGRGLVMVAMTERLAVATDGLVVAEGAVVVVVVARR